MKIEIKQDIRNELFNRNNMKVLVETDKNPTFEEAKKVIVEQTKKPEENIDVYAIQGYFGKKCFEIGAYVYDSKADLEKAIQKTQKQRKEEAKLAEEAKKAEEETKKEEGPETIDLPEQVQEKPEEKPTEPPIEERPEEEAKALKEEKQGEEEAKEN